MKKNQDYIALFEHLEERVLLSANPLAAALDTVDIEEPIDALVEEPLTAPDAQVDSNAPTTEAAAESASPPADAAIDTDNTPVNAPVVVFIDVNIQDYTGVIETFTAQAGAETVHWQVLETTQSNMLAQIATDLQAYENVAQVHVLLDATTTSQQQLHSDLNYLTSQTAFATELPAWTQPLQAEATLHVHGVVAETNGPEIAFTYDVKTGTADTLAQHDTADNLRNTPDSDVTLHWDTVPDTEQTELAFLTTQQLTVDLATDARISTQALLEQILAELPETQQFNAITGLDINGVAVTDISVDADTILVGQDRTDDIVITYTTLDNPEQRYELVFVDTAVDGYDALVAGIATPEGVQREVIVLEANRDGVTQITEVISQYHNTIAAVHIIAHAETDDRGLVLGNTELNLYSFDHYAADIGSWQTALTDNADILLYGCRLVEDSMGIHFVDNLAELTGADVAASDDNTGHADLGGDWVLEYQTGTVETGIAVRESVQRDWQHIAAIAAGYTEYYVPGATEQLWDIFVDLDNSPALNASKGMRSIIAVTASTDNTIIYYDHWEDHDSVGVAGYDADPLNPSVTTEIWGDGDISNGAADGVTTDADDVIKKGQVSLFKDTVPIPRGTDTKYDGRDRIYVVGGPASVTRTSWPESIGTVFALAWEVYPTKPFQSEYTIPVGQDLAPNYGDFTNVYAVIMSTDDGNVVQVDTDGDGNADAFDTDGDGSLEYTASPHTVTLNEGETIQVYDVNKGTTIKGTKPLQVQLIVGNTLNSWPSDGRGYTLVPNNLWDSEYYSPVGGPDTAIEDVDIYLYNPNDDQLIISYEDNQGTGTFPLNSKQTLSYQEAVGRYVPNKSGVYLEATNSTTPSENTFWGIGSSGTESDSYDWGYGLVPTYALSEQYFLGWAPGNSYSDPDADTTTYNANKPTPTFIYANGPLENGSPIYITPVEDNTTIFVDYDSDGVIDDTQTANRLQSIEIFDNTDNDNSGVSISATGKIAVAWGEDPDVNEKKAPYMDLGYTSLPLPPLWMNDVTLTVEKTAVPSQISDLPGTEVEFTINVPAYNVLTGLDIRDVLPPHWDYVAESTTINVHDQSGSVTELVTGTAAEPSNGTVINNSTVLLWDIDSYTTISTALNDVGDKVNLTPNDYIEIIYKASTTADAITASAAIGGYNENYVEAIGTYDGRTLTASDSKYIEITTGTLTISGTVYNDTAEDNTINQDEPTIQNATVTLYQDNNNDGLLDGGDTRVGNAVTTPTDGTYSFTNLLAGNYIVVETDASGYLSVTDEDGIGSNDNNTIDVTLTNANVTDQDFLDKVEPTYSISGTVFNDDTGDGTLDGANETPIQNATVRLYLDNNDNGVLDGGDTQVGADVTTLADGIYSFNNLQPDNYIVVETDAAGYASVTDKDGTGSNNINTIGVTLSNANVTDRDFLDEASLSISGKVYNDDTGDGALNGTDESPIEGVTIELYKDNNDDRIYNTGDTLIETAATLAADGSYSFNGLAPGNYVVKQTQPDGYASVADKDDGTDNEIAVNLGATSITERDFLERGNLAISGKVFNDDTGDGTLDGVNETPIQNATVRLYLDNNDNGVLDGGDTQVGADVITLADGIYSFNNLQPDNYIVVETDAAGYASVTDKDGTGSNNSNTIGVTLSNANVTDRDFLDEANLSISGKVYNDDTGDGALNGTDESPIEGVTIELYKDNNDDGIYNTGDTLIETATTLAADGSYSFNGLAPGNYMVKQTQPDGYASVADKDDGTDNEIAVNLGATSITERDFLERGNLAISGKVFNDDTGDGTLDGANETPIQNATVRLYLDNNDNGVLDGGDTQVGADLITSEDGIYSFNNLQPDNYIVVETDATGYASVTDKDGTGSNNSNTIDVTLSNANVTDQDFLDEVEPPPPPPPPPTTTHFISGKVYSDTNDDGSINSGDAALPNVTVALYEDKDKNGTYETLVKEVQTNASGFYIFDDLPNGNYQVQQTNLSGYTDVTDEEGTNDSKINVTLNGQDAPNRDFLDEPTPPTPTPTYTISGTVYSDTTDNNVLDKTEDDKLPGVEIGLYQDTNNDGTYELIATTTTDINGNYAFTDQPQGEYQIRQTNLPGYTDVSDADGGDANLIKVILEDDHATGQDFLDEQPTPAGSYSISGGVYSDRFDNDVIDSGDDPLPGVTVQLYEDTDSDGVYETLRDTQQTNLNGQYTFSGYPNGNYQVRQTNLDGYTDVWDKDNDNLNAINVTLNGKDEPGNNFLDELPPTGSNTISGAVYDDSTGNSASDFDPADSPISSVTVTLFADANGDGIPDDPTQPIETQTTDANGNYSFTEVPNGQYVVLQTDKPDYTSVTDKDGLSNGTSANAIKVDISNGGDSTGNNFLDKLTPSVVPGAIGDLIWNDLDGDGVQDPGEPGLAGVEVKLTTPSGAVLTATTNINGQYLFPNLTPGAYSVAVNPATVPATLSPSTGPQSIGGYNTSLNVNPGEIVNTIDFGYKPGTGTIGDYIWDDSNGDGIQDPNETGLSEVPVELTWAGPDGELGNGDDVTFNTTTDDNGRYQFNDLPAGQYQVAVTTPPAGKQPTSGDDSIGANSTTVNLAAGDTLNDIDFGYQGDSKGSIGDLVWYDIDGDGVIDPDEPGLANVTVTLTQPDGSTVQIETDAEGRYRFEDLPAGEYQVTIDPNDLPPGVNASLDNSTPFTLGNNEQKLDVDFGFTGTGQIGDYIWEDTDGDGIQDLSESGISDVPVELTWAGPDGELDTEDDVTYTTTTNADGRYQFTELPAGTFEVTVTSPPEDKNVVDGTESVGADSLEVQLSSGEVRNDIDFGYQAAGTSSIGDLVWYDTDGDGEFDPGEPGLSGITVILTKPDGTTVTTSTDENGQYRFDNLPAGEYSVSLVPSDLPDGMSSTFGSTAPFTLGDDEQKDDVDFGFRGNGSIGDYIWNDANANGLQDPTEQGLANVSVEVVWAGPDGEFGSEDDIVYTTVTDENGGYQVTDLAAGNYTVTVTDGIPADMTPTAGPESMGTNRVSIELPPSFNDRLIDFGYTGSVGEGKIGNLVWYDADGDGEVDPDEPPLSNVRVTLTGPDGLVVTVVTDDNGNYLFEDLPPGRYQVTVNPADLPDGVTLTKDSSTAFDLAEGEIKDDVIFGYVGTGRLGDYVWDDANGDGQQDNGETGFSNVNLQITWAGQDNVFDSDDDVVYTTTTDSNGNYLVEQLPAGRYQVEITDEVPPEYQPTVGEDSVGRTTTETLLTDGQIKLDIDFGFQNLQEEEEDDEEEQEEDEDNQDDEEDKGDDNNDGEDTDPEQPPVDDGETPPPTDGETPPPIDDGETTPPTDGETPPPVDDGETPPPTDGETPPPVDSGETTPPTNGETPPPVNGGVTPPPTNGQTPPVNGGLTPPPTNEQTPPPVTGGQTPPPTNEQTPPPVNGGQTPPPTNGQTPPPVNSGQTPPPTNGQTPPPVNGGQTPPPTNGQTPPPANGGQTPPPVNGGIIPPATNENTPPPYEYSVFHNEAEDSLFGNTRGEREMGEPELEDFSFHRSAELEWKMPVLPVAPIYSGIVASGTTLKVTLYSEHGTAIGEQTVVSDVGGNWLASFPNSIIYDMPHDVRVQQVTAVYNDNVMSLFHMRTYFAPALSPQLFFSHQTDVLTVMSTRPSQVLAALHQAYMRPFATQWNDFNEYEFFAGSVTTSQASF